MRISSTVLEPKGSEWVLFDGTRYLAFGDIYSDVQLRFAPEQSETSVSLRTKKIEFSDGLRYRGGQKQNNTLVFSLRVEKHSVADELLTFFMGSTATQEPCTLLSNYSGRQRQFQGYVKSAVTDRDRWQHHQVVTMKFETIHPGCTSQPLKLNLNYVPGDINGFVFPLAFPWSTQTDPVGNSQVVNLTTVETYPVVTIQGPLEQGEVRWTSGQFIRLKKNLAQGESITVDCRPWARKVFDQNGNNALSAVDWTSSKIVDMVLPAGTYGVSLDGRSPEATATAVVNHYEVHGTY